MPIGVYPRKNPSTMKTVVCETCGVSFTYKHCPFMKAPRRFCGQRCHMKFERERRRKVPHDYALLYDLYWNQNMTTVEIATRFDTDHSVVKHRMNQLGIPRRKPGHSRWMICRVDGCSQPIYRVKHKINGALYGSRCFFHWVEHRHRLQVDYWQNVRKKYPAFIEREKERKQRREIKQWTHLLSKLRKAVKEQDFQAIQSLQKEFAQAATSQTSCAAS